MIIKDSNYHLIPKHESLTKISSLKVGDYVKFVKMPSGYIHDETYRVFTKLIGKKKQVAHIDEDGIPVVRFTSGGIFYLLSIFDDGSWEFVEHGILKKKKIGHIVVEIRR